MPKFKKKASELKTRFDKWLYVFTNLQKLKDIPKELQETVFKKLFEVAEIAGFSEGERKEYEESLKNYRDIKNVVDTARAEGKSERNIEIAKQMKKDKESIEKIQRYTGLSKKEIEKL